MNIFDRFLKELFKKVLMNGKALWQSFMNIERTYIKEWLESIVYAVVNVAQTVVRLKIDYALELQESNYTVDVHFLMITTLNEAQHL